MENNRPTEGEKIMRDDQDLKIDSEVEILREALVHVMSHDLNSADSHMHPPIAETVVFGDLSATIMEESEEHSAEEVHAAITKALAVVFSAGCRLAASGVTPDTFVPCDCGELSDTDLQDFYREEGIEG